mgnify:CR=1 FL=1
MDECLTGDLKQSIRELVAQIETNGELAKYWKEQDEQNQNVVRRIKKAA